MFDRTHPSEHSIPLAAEDKFFIVSIRDAPELCPDGIDAEVLAEAFEFAHPYLGSAVPVFDIRGLPQIYNDVEQFLTQLDFHNAQVLLDSETASNLDMEHLKSMGMQPLLVKDLDFSPKLLDLSELRGDRADIQTRDPLNEASYMLASDLAYELVGDEPDVDEIPFSFSGSFKGTPISLSALQKVFSHKNVADRIASELGSELQCGITNDQVASSLQEFLPHLLAGLEGADPILGTDTDHEVIRYFLRAGLLHAFLVSLHRHSLLTEFVMTSNAGDITCAPYHSNALNEVAFPKSDELLLGRAGVFANKTNAVFRSEIEEFQRILNSQPKESEIQMFLERNPSFLKGLNYSHIYPQLILERDDKTSLRPDFLLEPFDDGWCDILDIKLPAHSITVGRKDRSTLAAGIHEIAAQLREYSAYFENPKYRKWVSDKYGLRVYRPRLIAVIGRDFRNQNEVEIRRAMTCYDNLQIITFDELLKHASRRLLI